MHFVNSYIYTYIYTENFIKIRYRKKWQTWKYVKNFKFIVKSRKTVIFIFLIYRL